jgi:hypothetical protein
MVEAGCRGQHRSPNGLHWPEVTLVVGESERVGIVFDRLAAQEVDLEAPRVDGGLVLK